MELEVFLKALSDCYDIQNGEIAMTIFPFSSKSGNFEIRSDVRLIIMNFKKKFFFEKT